MKLYWGKAPKEPTQLVNAQHFSFDFKKIQLYGGLVAVLVVFPLAYLAWRVRFGNAQIFGVFQEGPLVFIGLMVATVFVHELMHLLAQPWLGLGKQSYAGFDPKSGSPFAGYRGVVSKAHLIAMLLAPFFMLSVVPYLAAYHSPESWIPYLAWVSILNALGCVGDFLYAYLALKLPSGTYFQDGSYGPKGHP